MLRIDSVALRTGDLLAYAQGLAGRISQDLVAMVPGFVFAQQYCLLTDL